MSVRSQRGWAIWNDDDGDGDVDDDDDDNR